MRTNRYLYNVPLDADHTVLFNGAREEFLVVENNALNSFLQVLHFPDRYVTSHNRLIDYFKKMNFIVEDDDDEREALVEEREGYIHERKYKTSIIPTFECNYSCWYCLQKHEPVKIDPEKIRLIIRHVEKYLIENKIESYTLSWFGGEPMTQPGIIDRVSSELLEFCEANNIEFTGAITTNGALLNDDNIEMLARDHINYYQIAIDGDEKTHNKNKHDGTNDSSFGLVLTNIVRLLDANDMANVVLRLNYTVATLKSDTLIGDIGKYIPKEYRSRITVDLQKVWQIKENSVDIDLLRKLQENLVELGFVLSTAHIFSICYVDKDHYNMLYYNGGVEKCDKRPLNALRGHLDDDGNIVWNERPIFQDYDLFDESCVCARCRYYPLCYCGCPMERENGIMEHDGKIVCGYNGDYSAFEHRIRDFCWRVLNNRRLAEKTGKTVENTECFTI